VYLEVGEGGARWGRREGVNNYENINSDGTFKKKKTLFVPFDY
jgi:hypothetical protein